MPEEGDEKVAVGFPVVGIGASAGGLAAFEAFFAGMPPGGSPGMALVLVQHLAPDHESRLVDLIRRKTEMQVVEVEDGMPVERDRVYVIPPARAMALRNGRLRLLEPEEPRGHRLPIDFFFRSLAEDRQEGAIGVVLSGTGSDGTLGVREIKGQGGLVIAQDPDSTEYGGMPRSAIATGVVDYVLPPAEMPSRLLGYAGHAARMPREPALPTTPTDDEALGWIFSLLLSRTGHDFREYKRNSVRRRIARRMAVHQIETLEEYARYLEHDSEEVDSLFRDFLIGVTRFFRDPEAFEALGEEAIPRLLDPARGTTGVRVWVPGCSTGEEAYSIAILLRERMRAAKLGRKLQIFATDLDPRAVETARLGVYPASIAEDLSAERLDRFFTPERDGSAYRIRKDIRDLLVFSEQDLISDPPFSRIDLISCRNVLIYMGAELQKKLLPHFHYALNPGGVLFLGGSESVGNFGDLFETLDRKAKLYRKTEETPGRSRGLPGSIALTPGSRPPVPAAHVSTPAEPADEVPSLREMVERLLLRHHAPVAALVDASGEILYLHGRMGRFLEPAPGEVGMNVLEMAREGLRQQLTIALHRAAARGETVWRRGFDVHTDGKTVHVDLAVRPLPAPAAHPSASTLFLVVVDAGEAASVGAGEPPEAAGPETRQEEASSEETGTASRIHHLEEELRAKEEYLHAVQEEMQTSNEELRSAIEELQSTNEELQSTNEELETSKEELQSVNEELTTINAELETRVADLSRVENDMSNLLAGTGIGTLFVDHELRIQRFTPSATEILNLIDSDIGRPIGHLTSRLTSYDRLATDTERVLETLIPTEVEVQTEDCAWYLLRIRPYRTLENVIEGAVVTFTDITEVRAARETLRDAEAQRRLAVVVKDASDAVIAMDLERRITAWNPAAGRMYGWTEEEAMGMPYLGVVPEEEHEVTRAVIGRLAGGDAPEPFKARRRTREGATLTVWVTATPLVDEDGSIYAVATTERPHGRGRALDDGRGSP